MIWLSIWIVVVIINIALICHNVIHNRGNQHKRVIGTRVDFLVILMYSFVPIVNIFVTFVLFNEFKIKNTNDLMTNSFFGKCYDRILAWLYTRLP